MAQRRRDEDVATRDRRAIAPIVKFRRLLRMLRLAEELKLFRNASNFNFFCVSVRTALLVFAHETAYTSGGIKKVIVSSGDAKSKQV